MTDKHTRTISSSSIISRGFLDIKTNRDGKGVLSHTTVVPNRVSNTFRLSPENRSKLNEMSGRTPLVVK